MTSGPKRILPDTEGEAKQRPADTRDQEAGYWLRSIEACHSGGGRGSADPERITIRLAQYRGGDCLAILKATMPDGTPVVAFHSSQDITGCVIGLWAKLQNDGLTWMIDKFASGGGTK